MLIYFIAIYLFITFILTLFGIDRQSEAVKLFLISLILTPLAGLAWIVKNRPRAEKIHYYHCPECDYVYPVKMHDCPICAEEGKKVRLKKYKPPFDFSKNLQKLNVV